MIKKMSLGVVSLLVVAGISACEIMDSPSAAKPAESSKAEKVNAVPTWTPPTEGRWPDRSATNPVGYEQEFTYGNVNGPMLTGRVVSEPHFSNITDSEATISQTFAFTGEYPNPFELSDIDMVFRFGKDRFEEGAPIQVDASISCKKNTLALGEETECEYSARAKHEYFENSYWVLGSYFAPSIAIWPGQD